MVLVSRLDQLMNEIRLSQPGCQIHRKAVESIDDEIENIQGLVLAVKKEHYPDMLPKEEPVIEEPVVKKGRKWV